MRPAVLADAVLVVHGMFVLWAVFGVIAVWRWPRLALLHLPALAWAVWIEATGGVCPLTPLEVSLRRAAGEAGYSGGFLEHYLGGILYPEGLTRDVQIALGLLVIAVNAAMYLGVLRRKKTSRT